MTRRFLLLGALFPLALLAKPIDPQVVHGDASFQTSGHQMEIHSGKQTIINWKSFSIDSPEMVIFNQLDQNSIVLNRVTGFDGSAIFGKLLSNGNVILINPNGILFGKDSVVDTHSLIASALDLSNSDFINGNDLIFSGNSDASVINLGTIQAKGSTLTLLGRFVKNEGNLSAPNGTVTLAAGTEILVKPSGSQRVFISTQEFDGKPSGTGILNTGSIDALKIHLLADGNPYDLAIRQEGKINATNLIEHGGEIYLVAEGGKIEVTGNLTSPYGEIRFLGKEVGILDSSFIDVSSLNGGGEILIGGSFQGKDPNIYNSQYTYVAKETKIIANATEKGDGGRVILWSDGVTGFYGHIETIGGPFGGDGGFVEVSGKTSLDMKGFSDRSAPNGRVGTLLLDPTEVTITINPTNPIAGWPPNYIPTGVGTFNLLNTDLVAQLGGPVQISTTSGSGGNGDITISAPVIYGPPSGNLTLTSFRDIIVNEQVQSNGFGAITCNAGRHFVIDGTSATARIGSRQGTTTVNTGQVTTPGNVTITGGAGGVAQLGFDTSASITGNIAVNIPDGNLTIGPSTTNSLIGHTNATSSINGNINITILDGNVAVTGGAAQSHIGHDMVQTATGAINGALLTMDIAGDISVLGAVGDAFIGHRNAISIGNSTINLSIDGDLSVGSSTSGVSQVGHYYPVDTGASSTGSSIFVTTGGSIFINGGVGQGQIGHNGRLIGGNIVMNAIGVDLIMNSYDAEARLGSFYSDTVPTYNGADGSILLFVGRDVIFNDPASIPSPTGNAQVQIGHDAVVTFSDVQVSAGRNFDLNSIGSFTLIGHTCTRANPTVTGVQTIKINGNVNIAQFTPYLGVGGGISLTAGNSTVGAFPPFSQIGHAAHLRSTGTTLPTSVSGNVNVNDLKRDISILGGSVRNAYALIGHGGIPRDNNVGTLGDSFFAPFIIGSTEFGNITIQGGAGTEGAFAGFGFGENYASAAPLNPHSLIVDYLGLITENGNMTLQAGSSGVGGGNNHAFLGAFLDTVTTTPGSLVTNVTINNMLSSVGGSVDVIGDSIGNQTFPSHAVIGLISQNDTVTGSSTSIYFNVENDLNIYGGSPTTGFPSDARIANAYYPFFNGYLNIAVNNGNFNILGGSNAQGGDAHVYSKGSLNIYVPQGDFTMESNEGIAIIETVLDSTILVGNDIIITGDPTPPASGGFASILGRRQLDITAGNDITMNFNARIRNNQRPINITAGNSMYMLNPPGVGNFPLIRSVQQGDITIVVDNNFPTYPGIGPGAFIMDSKAVIRNDNFNTGELGLIRIYTALQSQNVILGTINFATFTPGTLYADLPPEKWETYYPDPFYHTGSPFTIFYKDGPLYIDTIQRTQVVVSEILAEELHPVDEYLGWFMEFQTAYDTDEYQEKYYRGTSSYQLVPDQPYYLRMQKEYTYNPRQNNLIIFPKKIER